MTCSIVHGRRQKSGLRSRSTHDEPCRSTDPRRWLRAGEDTTSLTMYGRGPSGEVGAASRHPPAPRGFVPCQSSPCVAMFAARFGRVVARLRVPRWRPRKRQPPPSRMLPSFFIDMQQVTALDVFLAADRFAGSPVDMRQPVHPTPDQHRMHGRGGQTELTGDTYTIRRRFQRTCMILRAVGCGVLRGLWCGRANGPPCAVHAELPIAVGPPETVRRPGQRANRHRGQLRPTSDVSATLAWTRRPAGGERFLDSSTPR